MGRPKKTVDSKGYEFQLNQVAREYLEAIAQAGTFGNSWSDVASRFIGEGIERAIANNVIPRRRQKVSYDTVNDPPTSDAEQPVASF